MEVAVQDKDRLREGAEQFLLSNPDMQFVDAFLVDLNGVLRGKRLRAGAALKCFESGLRLPRSTVATDVWGGDVQDSELLFESGDRDGLCVPVGTGVQPIPWAERPMAQLLTMMREADGSPFAADPRQQLVNSVQRCARLGLFPVAAFELEFSLFAADLDDMGRPSLPPAAGKARRLLDGRMYAVDELDAYGAFFADLYAACDQQEVPLESAIVEAGPGQFEVNLLHQDDALRAADHAILLRRAIKGVAARHNLLATFMAKPFAERAGNGMHLHLSLRDEHGRNIFNDGSPEGASQLRQSVAGLIATAPEAMIFFAPHLNSMRRFQDGSHAPTRANWGYDNRTVAIRIPADGGDNQRFEHRIAGADANPYLVLSAILNGLLHGIEQALVPATPVDGNGYEAPGVDIPTDWADALQSFANGALLAPAFGPLFTSVYCACKRQEIGVAAARITDFEYDSYLQTF